MPQMASKSDKVKLSPPWVGHMSMLASFFKGDKRVRIGSVEGRTGIIEVFCNDMYQALSLVLRQKIRFGNVTLNINLVPSNGMKLKTKEMSDLDALKVVLKKNPAFDKIRTTKDGPMQFVTALFKPVVLQWYNDNIGNPWKLTTSIFESEANKVFKGELGICWSTSPLK